MARAAHDDEDGGGIARQTSLTRLNGSNNGSGDDNSQAPAENSPAADDDDHDEGAQHDRRITWRYMLAIAALTAAPIVSVFVTVKLSTKSTSVGISAAMLALVVLLTVIQLVRACRIAWGDEYLRANVREPLGLAAAPPAEPQTVVIHFRNRRRGGAQQVVRVDARHLRLMLQETFTPEDYDALLQLDEQNRISQFLQGAAVEEISRLPTYKYRSSADSEVTTAVKPGSVAGEEDNDAAHTCVICMERFKHGDDVMVLPCMQQFHTSCITPWLAQKAVCPTCQASIRDPMLQAAGMILSSSSRNSADGGFDGSGAHSALSSRSNDGDAGRTTSRPATNSTAAPPSSSATMATRRPPQHAPRSLSSESENDRLLSTSGGDSNESVESPQHDGSPRLLFTGSDAPTASNAASYRAASGAPPAQPLAPSGSGPPAGSGTAPGSIPPATTGSSDRRVLREAAARAAEARSASARAGTN